MNPALRRVVSDFRIDGELLRAEPLGSGHIHDTFVAVYGAGGREWRCVHQRLNDHVFPDLTGVMDNLVRVLAHLRAKLVERGDPDASRRCLELVPARAGGSYVVDTDGAFWRTFVFLEGSESVDSVTTPRQAFEVARVCGEFAALMFDLDAPLAIPIPGFHDLAGRFAAFESAVAADAFGRVAAARREIDAVAEAFAHLSAALQSAGADSLRERVVHNDCKVNNVMLDRESGEGLCLIDLDTVMPGTLLWDFGELLRTAACHAPEDAHDLDAMRVEPGLLRAAAEGYVAGTGATLDDAELEVLPLAGTALAFENAARFLTDHLEGDHYFKAEHADHNLQRCRAQQRRSDLLAASAEELRALLRR